MQIICDFFRNLAIHICIPGPSIVITAFTKSIFSHSLLEIYVSGFFSCIPFNDIITGIDLSPFPI